MSDRGYEATLQRRGEILLRASGIDYGSLEVADSLAFDYDALMRGTGYDLPAVAAVQADSGVGSTPLLELKNVTALVRALAAPGKGARVLVKDEAANPSGSFKDRRASVSAHHARRSGFEGLVAATSGNYGAAVASQAARHGLRAIIVQETFDSHGRGQPEILEKGRKCEALGAEVLQTTVGPELFFVLLRVLEETGYFNASLYTPFSVVGIETLGVEIAEQTRRAVGRDPDAVLVTHAGGGNVTGVARGLASAGCDAQVVGVSVDLSGLHMASDGEFNRKSFTTGHTGFAMPFTAWPDRVDVPRNAARPLRYLDRLVTVTQGEVFYVT
jgi:cysteine synthase